MNIAEEKFVSFVMAKAIGLFPPPMLKLSSSISSMATPPRMQIFLMESAQDVAFPYPRSGKTHHSSYPTKLKTTILVARQVYDLAMNAYVAFAL